MDLVELSAETQSVQTVQGESVEKVKAYLASENLALENIPMDSTGALARKLGTAGLPTTFYFDAKKILFDTTIGGVSHATLAQQIRLLRDDHSRHAKDVPSGPGVTIAGKS